MNTMNLQGGSTQNVFGQNYTNNLNTKKEEKKYSNENLNSKKDLNNFLTEKDRNNKDTRDTSQNKVNSRLDNIKEKFDVYKINNLAGEKDEIDSSLNLLKEKISKKTNNNNTNHNPNNLSNINNVSITNNSVGNCNNNNNNYNTNPNNKINLITPASSRDCGVFDSNFVLKTDKRSFLLNENTSYIDPTKRKVSEDK